MTPQTDVVLYREDDGTVPLRAWFLASPPKAADKCLACLKRLEQLGHELRKPELDDMRDRGDSFALTVNGVEIEIVRVVDGNYDIRKVE